MVRQQRWKRKQIEGGRCAICGKRKLYTTFRCRTCHEIHKRSMNAYNASKRRARADTALA